MMDERPLGLVIVIVGIVGTLVAALADPLGIGEGEVFGWLQITGVILGGLVILLGLALGLEWIPYPGRRADTVTTGSQNTTIVEGRPPADDTTVVNDPPPERAPPP